MTYLKYVLSVYMSINLLASADARIKNCKDCMKLRECDPELVVDKTNLEKIKDAICGYDNAFKVCCSELKDDEVESHPNFNLLPNDCGMIHKNRIIGGEIPDLYELPWMALISYNTNDERRFAFQCAGSIINSRYILTAAHCIVDRNLAGVRVGDFDVSQQEDCQLNVCESHYQDIRIAEVIYHKKYVGIPNFAHDIGLLRLASPIDLSRRNAKPICLPKTKKLRTASIVNKSATVAGWGLTEEYRESSVLRKVDIPIQDQDTCLSFHSRIIVQSDQSVPSQFCAGAYHKDSCQGDSGGPVIIKDDKGVKYIQYGIVSQGVESCGSITPSIYTTVSSYMLWILNNIKP